MDPVAQGLPIHPAGFSRRLPRLPFQDESQRKCPACVGSVLASGGLAPEIERGEVLPGDRNRHFRLKSDRTATDQPHAPASLLINNESALRE
jgi:hypothetical protein